MTSSNADRVYARVTWRPVPFLFLCYIFAYLDRVNVSFAKLQMSDALGFSEATYGLGAGVFFLGYFLFEIPSNLALHRYGARRTIARIMILWGLISAATLLSEKRRRLSQSRVRSYSCFRSRRPLWRVQIVRLRMRRSLPGYFLSCAWPGIVSDNNCASVAST